MTKELIAKALGASKTVTLDDLIPIDPRTIDKYEKIGIAFGSNPVDCVYQGSRRYKNFAERTKYYVIGLKITIPPKYDGEEIGNLVSDEDPFYGIRMIVDFYGDKK